MAEWQDAYGHLRTVLGLPESDPTPKMPRPAPQPLVTLSQSNGSAPPVSSADGGKRKAPDADGETNGESETTQAPQNDESKKTKGKRAKKNGAAPPPPPEKSASEAAAGDEAELAHARAVAAYIPFLQPENLMQPKLPTREEMEKFILDLRKKALVEEYFGDEETS